MKKIFLGLSFVLIVLFAFVYQKPLMTTGKAVKQAIACVNNPPKRLSVNPINYTLNDLQTYHSFIIEAKSGFFHQLTNQREMTITLVFESKEPTVTMNAYNGECIGISGPLR